MLKAGTWYMVARAEGEARTFRLSSIHTLQVLDERFARPRRFDLGKYWTASTARFDGGAYRGEAVLRVSPLGFKRLQAARPAVAAAAARTASEPEPDGWMRVTIPIDSAEDAARELLRLGAEGEALAPEELRQLMKETAERLAALYRREDAPKSASRRTRRTSPPARAH